MKAFTNVARIGYILFVPNDLLPNPEFPSKFFCSTRKIRRMEKYMDKKCQRAQMLRGFENSLQDNLRDDPIRKGIFNL